MFRHAADTPKTPGNAPLPKTKKAERKERRQRAGKLRQQKKNTARLNTAFAKKAEKQRAPKSAADCLKLEHMYESGLCEIQPGLWSSTLKFYDINYQIARKEEQANIFTRYCELLNYCDPQMHLQIDLITRHMDQDDFEAQMFLPPAQDGLDEHRREMNRIVADKAQEGQNGLLREKYLTVTVRAENYGDALQQLSRRESDLQSQLKGLGSACTPLSGLQRLRLISGILRPAQYMNFQYDWLLAEEHLRAKDFICPSAFDFKPEHDGSRAVYNDRYRFGPYVGKTVFLRDIAPEMTDDLLSQLTDLPFDLVITLHIDAVDQYLAIEQVKTKLAYMHQEQGDGMTKAVRQGLPPQLGVRFEVQESIDQAQKLLDDLQNRNQKMFKTTILVHTFGANNTELDDRVKQICSTVQKKTCKFDTLEFQQLDALNSILPIGKKYLSLERTLTTASAAIFIPFTTQELFQPGGIYEGLNARSRNLVVFDRKSLASPNGMILGQPGSGKSMAAKREMANILMRWPDDEVIVIDPEGEYAPMAQSFDGEIIDVSAASEQHINPMDITDSYGDDDNPLRLKSQFLMSFCELIAGGGGISASEKTFIDRACRRTYSHYFAHPDRMQMPALTDFYANLVEQGPQARDIATALSIYVDGTMDVFAHQTNVDIHKRFVVYNIVNLGKQLQTLGMMVVLDQIWNRVTLNRQAGTRTWSYIDEIQLLLNDAYCSNYFFSISGRSRKWGAILTGITQHVETLLLNDDARRMLADCQYVKLLNQHQNDRQHLGELLGISSEELSYITNADPGYGLLIAGKAVVPLADDFPKNTNLYRVMSTNPNERQPLTRF